MSALLLIEGVNACGLHMCVSPDCVGNIFVFRSKRPQQQHLFLGRDGRDPNGFLIVLLILSHQHEMLIVLQLASRRPYGLRAPCRQRCSLICAWVLKGLGFLTIHLRFFVSLTRKSVPLGCHCILYRAVCLSCSEAETLLNNTSLSTQSISLVPHRKANRHSGHQHFTSTNKDPGNGISSETDQVVESLEREVIENSRTNADILYPTM